MIKRSHGTVQGGDWEAALERYNVQREQSVGIPLSPTGLSRQGTRKLGSLGRTSTVNPLTRQATMNVSNAGSKRAQAVENLKQQVEELKTKLQVKPPVPAPPHTHTLVQYAHASKYTLPIVM